MLISPPHFFVVISRPTIKERRPLHRLELGSGARQQRCKDAAKLAVDALPGQLEGLFFLLIQLRNDLGKSVVRVMSCASQRMRIAAKSTLCAASMYVQ